MRYDQQPSGEHLLWTSKGEQGQLHGFITNTSPGPGVFV